MKIHTYGMDDVGTRLQHLAELHLLWSDGLEILTRGTYHSSFEQEQALELEHALKLLSSAMEIDYKPTKYAQVINSLPADPTEIKDENQGPDLRK